MIALIKEEKKIAPSPYPNCNKAVVPLEVNDIWQCWWLSGSLVPVLEPKLELHNSLKFGVCVIYYTWLKTLFSCLCYYMSPTLLFFCSCSWPTLFLRVLSLPCFLFYLDSFNLWMIYIPLGNSLGILHALWHSNTKQWDKYPPMYLFKKIKYIQISMYNKAPHTLSYRYY